MNHKFSFEKLDVWKQAKGLAVDIYRLSANFPDIEKYGLQSQIRRAAVSVPSNIAEGSSRFSSKSKANFYQIAFSSLMEVYSHLHIAKDLEYVEIDESIIEKVMKVSNLLNSLHKSTTK
ncbi:MAG: four helix bundle protein [Bacteroidales bacterium]|nr:four helix bundle protein [Bacteroidales bacterium]